MSWERRGLADSRATFREPFTSYQAWLYQEPTERSPGTGGLLSGAQRRPIGSRTALRIIEDELNGGTL